MLLLIISFFAGVLTILAPCVLPLLPIILSGSIENPDDKKGPYIIIASLGFSILVFSILLKATTVFIKVPQSFWSSFSGVILILLGIITIFPNLWKSISAKLGFDAKSNKLFSNSTTKTGNLKNIAMGFSLGPVFSSCSPTYALILAVILPTSFFVGLINLVSYILGLSLMLFLISSFGQSIVKRLKIFANPKSNFKKILGFIFLLVGISFIFGFDKYIEKSILNIGYLGPVDFEQDLLKKYVD